MLRRELAGIALILFALFLAGSLAMEGAALLGAQTGGLRTNFGWMGALLASPMAGTLGWPAAALIPVALTAHALRLFGRLDQHTDRSWMVFLLGMVAVVPVALGLAEGGLRDPSALSGVWGSMAAFYLLRFAGSAGAWIIVILSVSALMAATLSWNPVRAVVGTSARRGAEPGDNAEGVDGTADGGALSRPRTAGQWPPEPTPEEMPAIDTGLMSDAPGRGEKAKRDKKSKAELAADHDSRIAAAIDSTGARTGDANDDDLPSPDLLTSPPARNVDHGNRELDAMGIKLMDALRTFRVEGTLTGRTTGPVVTQFEIEPAAGVKVRQFASLANDLALAMRAPSIRVVAPIPGKGAVGVEVPNPTSEMVAFREMLESRDYQKMPAALPIALGKDLEGRPVIADLAKMPHLLIAGATGSGKSVCINTLITSLIYRHTPKTLRLLMVDPKMVELSVYNVLPHLRHKVVTDNRDAAAVLKWAVLEMQDRYELLAANGARNIQDFNRKVHDGAALKTPKRADVAFENTEYTGGVLPYIVLIIDELADLMMTVQAEIETPLAMLAQKARAIGIHIILATQRPSVNVLTGLIKANFASRIAFRVASQIDSRTILDGIGAESLLGNGDMLFVPPGRSEPSRLQGAFISSEDTERLAQWYEDRKTSRRAAAESKGLFLEEPKEADILETIRKKEAEDALGGGDGDGAEEGDRDKLFREAAEIVIQHQQGSTSLLQRRLKVGYGRAARIIDQLHAAGILGPPDGSRPRDVLAGLDDLDRICGPRA
ncbi:MAG: DNA translocase FtsK 4TM domain-containing protein [Gemmatimonadaceae bacterium]|nr:DNA translocase FtsK 4TM domain-containing protein [Gemmatimonadaceae bacterium]